MKRSNTRFLARRVERPRPVVVVVAVRAAEQALESAVRREGVPFKVQEHVPVRRLRQPREPLVGLDRRDELVDAAVLAPRLVLHPRLLADAGQRRLADPVEPGRDRQAQRPQRRHRRHLPFGQPSPLASGDAGDQREVTVGATPLRAGLLPLADAAVIDRLRKRVRRGGDVRLEPPRDGAVVRCVLRDPEARRALAAAAEPQMHQLGFDALRLRQQVRVQKKLQQRLALRPAGQLRIEHLVGPPSQCARQVDPEQEIRIAAPPSAGVLEAPLVDHVGPAPHRVPSPRGDRHGVPMRERRVGRDDRLDGASVRRQLIPEALLVLEAALSQHLGAGIVVRQRRHELPARNAPAQTREVIEGEMAAQVGCRERELAVGMEADDSMGPGQILLTSAAGGPSNPSSTGTHRADAGMVLQRQECVVR